LSHLKERKERNCLNCNAHVYGRFCHICGQENVEPKESVWHLVSHFFQDITHFDGKFFSTLRYLIFKPGFLSREYMLGRRQSYLNPIRMYVFTSAIFFLFFFSLVPQKEIDSDSIRGQKQKVTDLQKTITGLQTQQTFVKDTVLKNTILKAIVKMTPQLDQAKTRLRELEYKDSVRTARRKHRIDSTLVAEQTKKGNQEVVSILEMQFNTVMGYDTVQSLLPPEKRDGYWRRLTKRKGIDVSAKAIDDNDSFSRTIMDKFLHTLPQLLFLSLPAYTFLLWLLYRRQKNYYYANHAIYTIHFFCFTFIMTFFMQLGNRYFPESNLVTVINTILFLLTFFYQYKSMRVFYQQRRGKTILKFIILNIASTIVMSILAGMFFIISLWKI
jgi:hypothetical protein